MSDGGSGGAVRGRGSSIALLRHPAFVAGATLAILAVVRYPLKVTEQTEVRPAERREVRAMVEGIIAEIHKQEGDLVGRGDLLATLDQRAHRARLAVLDAEHERLRAELERLERGNRPQEIRSAEAVVGRRRAALELARAKLARARTLSTGELVSREALETAQFEAEAEAGELSDAEARLNLMRAGSRSEDVRAKQAEMGRIEAERDFVRAELERGRVRSPIDGILMTPRFHEKLGRAVRPGDLLAEVAEFRRMRVEIMVPERELDAVAPGQPVLMKVKSYPGLDFAGRVEFIPAVTSAGESDGVRVVRVVAYVDNPGQRLKDRMTGWAEIDCGRRSLLSLGLRRAVRWFRVRFVI